jgi:hypothetical protein
VLPAAGCRWLSAALAAGKQMVAGCPCFQKEKVADKRSTVHGLYLFYVGNKRKKHLKVIVKLLFYKTKMRFGLLLKSLICPATVTRHVIALANSNLGGGSS